MNSDNYHGMRIPYGRVWVRSPFGHRQLELSEIVQARLSLLRRWPHPYYRPLPITISLWLVALSFGSELSGPTRHPPPRSIRLRAFNSVRSLVLPLRA